MSSLASQDYRKTPVWPVVRSSQEEATILDEGREWSPYPFRTPIRFPFFYAVARTRNELVSVVNKIALFAFAFPKQASAAMPGTMATLSITPLSSATR